MTSSDSAGHWVGRRAERRIRITGAMLEGFVELSGDRSPIHVSDAAAQARGFRGRVVHGMLLGSLVSAVVGIQLPGEDGVLQEMRLSLRNPCYVDDDVVIHVEVSEYFESVQTLVLKVKVAREDGLVLATGHVQSGLRSGHG